MECRRANIFWGEQMKEVITLKPRRRCSCGRALDTDEQSCPQCIVDESLLAPLRYGDMDWVSRTSLEEWKVVNSGKNELKPWSRHTRLTEALLFCTSKVRISAAHKGRCRASKQPNTVRRVWRPALKLHVTGGLVGKAVVTNWSWEIRPSRIKRGVCGSGVSERLGPYCPYW